MARFSYSTLIFIILILSVALGLWGCRDLVKEDVKISACNKALNDRKYDTALSKCTARKDRAAAYLGKAGYDIISLLNSSSGKANNNATIKALLGTENVSLSYTVNILKLGPNKIPDDTARETAMRNSKIASEKVVDLYDHSLSLTGEEMVLKTLGTMFAASLEIILLLDIGLATTLDITNNFRDNLVATRGKHLITADPSIPESSVAVSTILDTINSVEVSVDKYLKKLDGHLWTTERNQALMPGSIALGPVTRGALGIANDRLELYGNLPAVCRSLTNTKTASDPPGRGILVLVEKFNEALVQFKTILSDASDAAKKVTSLNLGVFRTAINHACDLQARFSALP